MKLGKQLLESFEELVKQMIDIYLTKILSPLAKSNEL
jgi:hypothetical protein